MILFDIIILQNLMYVFFCLCFFFFVAWLNLALINDLVIVFFFVTKTISYDDSCLLIGFSLFCGIALVI